jgi:hypothetical protein
MCGRPLKTIFRKFENSPWGHYMSKKLFKKMKNLILSKLQLQNFHENSTCFKSPFICLKHSRKTCGHVVFLYQKSFSLTKCSPNSFNFL